MASISTGLVVGSSSLCLGGLVATKCIQACSAKGSKAPEASNGPISASCKCQLAGWHYAWKRIATVKGNELSVGCPGKAADVELSLSSAIVTAKDDLVLIMPGDTSLPCISLWLSLKDPQASTLLKALLSPNNNNKDNNNSSSNNNANNNNNNANANTSSSTKSSTSNGKSKSKASPSPSAPKPREEQAKKTAATTKKTSPTSPTSSAAQAAPPAATAGTGTPKASTSTSTTTGLAVTSPVAIVLPPSVPAPVAAPVALPATPDLAPEAVPVLAVPTEIAKATPAVPALIDKKEADAVKVAQAATTVTVEPALKSEAEAEAEAAAAAEAEAKAEEAKAKAESPTCKSLSPLGSLVAALRRSKGSLSPASSSAALQGPTSTPTTAAASPTPVGEGSEAATVAPTDGQEAMPLGRFGELTATTEGNADATADTVPVLPLPAAAMTGSPSSMESQASMSNLNTGTTPRWESQCRATLSNAMAHDEDRLRQMQEAALRKAGGRRAGAMDPTLSGRVGGIIFSPGKSSAPSPTSAPGSPKSTASTPKAKASVSTTSSRASLSGATGGGGSTPASAFARTTRPSPRTKASASKAAGNKSPEGGVSNGDRFDLDPGTRVRLGLGSSVRRAPEGPAPTVPAASSPSGSPAGASTATPTSARSALTRPQGPPGPKRSQPRINNVRALYG